MPWKREWKEPELFIKYNNISIYHTYPDGDIEKPVSKNIFTLDKQCGAGECSCNKNRCDNVFDIRTLPNWSDPPKQLLNAGQQSSWKYMENAEYNLISFIRNIIFDALAATTKNSNTTKITVTTLMEKTKEWVESGNRRNKSKSYPRRLVAPAPLFVEEQQLDNMVNNEINNLVNNAIADGNFADEALQEDGG